MLTFNLIEEPWIPCIGRTGPEVLSIRDTVLRAHELLEIADPSPLITLGLQRLLLALVHRVFGPASIDAWGELWSREAFDADALDWYFTEWRNRFDLFDSTHPFYQGSDLDVPPDKNDAYALMVELSTSTPKMFSHVNTSDPPALTPAEAARALVGIQPFHRAGLIGKKSGGGPASCVAGPLAGGAVSLLMGNSLFETLLLNAVRYNPEDGLPFTTNGKDMPVWERDEPLADEERIPDGYLDWLTWISWLVRLAPDEREGAVIVRRAYIVRGNQLRKEVEESTLETMVAYRKDPKLGIFPISLRRERSVWRDSGALFQSTDTNQRPRTLTEIAYRVQDGHLSRKATYPLGVYGVQYDQANALFWRCDRLPLPLAYLEDEALFGKLQSALALAEGGGDAVRWATKVLAAYLLDVDPDGKLPRSKSEALTKRRDGLGAERRYWARLDPHFSRYLIDQAETGDAALVAWRDQILQAARQAYESVAEGLGLDGETLRIEVSGRARLERGLARAQRDHPVSDKPRKEAS